MNEWTSVEDALPEENVPVLCYGKDKYSAEAGMAVMAIRVDDESLWWEMLFVDADGHFEPTHWAELPSGPERDGA